MVGSKAHRIVSGFVFAATLTLGGVGCSGNRPNNPDDDILIRVETDMNPPSSLSIYLVPDGGIRRLLGTINGSSGTVRIENPPIGRYRLLARTDLGREIISDPVIPVMGASLKWDLYTNVISAARG
jgi:hypothetical protein